MKFALSQSESGPPTLKQYSSNHQKRRSLKLKPNCQDPIDLGQFAAIVAMPTNESYVESPNPNLEDMSSTALTTMAGFLLISISLIQVCNLTNSGIKIEMRFSLKNASPSNNNGQIPFFFFFKFVVRIN